MTIMGSGNEWSEAFNKGDMDHGIMVPSHPQFVP